MCKRMLVCITILLLAGTTSFAVGVGIFDEVTDVGTGFGTRDANPLGIGSVVQEAGNNVYRITAGGSDIWEWEDHFTYAYKTITGDVRISSAFSWQDAGWNDWAKMGVMLRADTGAGSVTFQNVTRKGGGSPQDVYGDNGDSVFFQGRPSSPGGSAGFRDWWGANPAKLGIQKISLGIGNLSLIEALVDQGGAGGWELVGSRITNNLPSTYLAGVAVTAHDNAWMVQARAKEVMYEENPTRFTQFTTIDNPDGTCPQIPGFKIRSIKVGMGVAWPSGDGNGYNAMNTLLTTGEYPANNPGEEEGTRIDQVVNLHDSDDGGRGAFFGIDYPDTTFPGIDDYESPTVMSGDPAGAAGDADDNFATEVLACIQLTAGLHIIGANSDDGTIIWIGGVEIGRSGEWKGADNADFLFEVATAGLYSFKARMLEGGGGAALELHEILPDGTRILLGDTARGGSPVYVPEPATIALLGLGGLSLLGSRRKH